VEPDAGTAALHKERFQRYREMYDVTRPLIRGISGSEN
jgi:hypothetical protein